MNKNVLCAEIRNKSPKEKGKPFIESNFLKTSIENLLPINLSFPIMLLFINLHSYLKR
jgi:hypothetical protein